MPISAPIPCAARGSERAVFRRICSRDSWEGARVMPCPPSASSSWSSPPRSSGSGISSISWAAPASTPMSLALRPQCPSGSRSRGTEGATESQTAVRVARCASLSTAPASSPAPIALDFTGDWPAGQGLREDEVVAVHCLLRGVRQQLADLLGAEALDLAELAGRVVDDPLADRLAVGGDLDGVTRLELALDLGDADGQQ